MQQWVLRKSRRNKNCYGLLLTRIVFNMRRYSGKACSSLHHKPLEVFSRKCACCELPISLPVSCCFRMLWMHWEQMPLAQHCCSQALDTERSAEGQSIFEASPTVEVVPTCCRQTIPDLFSGNLNHSHNPTKLTSFSLGECAT